MSDPRSAYHQEIEDVRSTVVRLAGSVIEAIPARPASCSRATSRADYLISADDEIDARSPSTSRRRSTG